MIDFENGSFIKLKRINPDVVSSEITPLLIEDEEMISAYKAMRDYVVFTDKRVISVNTQGISGKKKDFTSLPYAKISVFSVETSGIMDLDSELELYFSGVGKVIFEFSGESNIIEIGQLISSFALK